MTQSRAKAEWTHGEGRRASRGCNREEMLAALGQFTPSGRLTVAGVGPGRRSRPVGLLAM